MLVVIPVADSDTNRLPSFLKNLQAFGPYPQDTVLIVPTLEMSERSDGKDFAREVSSLFGSSHIRALPNTPTDGWPSACNKHFQFGVIYQSELKINQEWIWLESDCTLLTKAWLDELHAEYVMERKPYMGMVETTYKITINEQGLRTRREGGIHMVGAGVYPPNYHLRAQLWKTPHPRIPFDVYGQHETTVWKGQNICHQSRTMLHKWGTVNYREENGVVVCDDQKKDEFGLTYAGPVDLAGKVLVHGCKDGSLVELVLKGFKPAVKSVVAETVSQAAQKTLETAEKHFPPVQLQPITLDGQDVEVLIPGVWIKAGTRENTIERLGFFLRNKLPPAPEASNPGLGDNTDQTSDTPATSGASEGAEDASEVIHTQPAPVSGGAQTFPSESLIQAVLDQSPKATRLGALMDSLQIPKSEKEAFTAHLSSIGFTASAPAFWVKKAA